MHPEAAFPTLLSWANTAQIVFSVILSIVDDSDPHDTEFGSPVSVTLARLIGTEMFWDLSLLRKHRRLIPS